jgi:antitoxin Phd
MTEHFWPVQDAKARFSEFLEACVNDGPQVVTKRGHATAVLVSFAEWQRLCHAAKPSLKGLLLGGGGPSNIQLPQRGRSRRRRLPQRAFW